MSTSQANRQSVEQMLAAAQVTSYTEELDLVAATGLTPAVLGALCRSMPSLKRINVHGCALTALPPEIGKLSQLRELNISNNLLTVLPDTLAQLPSLQHLNVAKNHLLHLPENLAELTSLRLFNANNNRLTTLPAELANLQQLRVLRLGANALRALPASFAKLRGLRLLQLGHNAFKEIPAPLLRMQSLSVLDVSFNKIEVLPDTLRGMPALASLNVTGNALKQVPAALALPQELKVLGLHSVLPSVPYLDEEATRPQGGPALGEDSDSREHTQGAVMNDAPRPDFHGPQGGQLDVTGIFLAGLETPVDDASAASPADKGRTPRQ